jgi:hypothetical protein
MNKDSIAMMMLKGWGERGKRGNSLSEFKVGEQVIYKKRKTRILSTNPWATQPDQIEHVITGCNDVVWEQELKKVK